MKISREVNFEHAGCNLSVRAVVDSAVWRVGVFDGEVAATGYSYTVSHLNALDARMSGSGELVEGLMDLARDDVIHGRARLV